jgi:hypothetical protein
MVSYPPGHPRRIYGVDFSGAAKAGKKIWIASGVIEGSPLRIEACRRAADLPGLPLSAAQGQVGQDRGRCLASLRDFVQREAASAFGFDFPFGLPRDLVAEDSWEEFILSFPDRYASPEEFRETCRKAAGDSELKRVTDQESRTPFSPYNLRLYRQTYFGIRDVLAPLVRDQQACVLPMQPALPGRAWVMEICPASTLKRESLNRSYKGKGPGRYVARAYILEEIERRASLSIPGPLRPAILEDHEGDALDSVVAASAVFRALRDPGRLAVGGNDVYALEGYVYV